MQVLFLAWLPPPQDWLQSLKLLQPLQAGAKKEQFLYFCYRSKLAHFLLAVTIYNQFWSIQVNVNIVFSSIE